MSAQSPFLPRLARWLWTGGAGGRDGGVSGLLHRCQYKRGSRAQRKEAEPASLLLNQGHGHEEKDPLRAAEQDALRREPVEGGGLPCFLHEGRGLVEVKGGLQRRERRL